MWGESKMTEVMKGEKKIVANGNLKNDRRTAFDERAVVFACGQSALLRGMASVGIALYSHAHYRLDFIL